MAKSYTKNFKTLHVNRFLNQKELNAKAYAEKEGINPSTFRNWISDATSPSPRSHKPKKKVTTKATTKLSSSTTTKPAFAENTNKYEYIIIGYGVLVTLVLLIAAVCYIIK